MSLGSNIDRLVQLKKKKEEAQAVVDAIAEQYKELEQSLLDQLNSEGMKKASGKLATFSRKQSLVPTVDNWDLFGSLIIKQKAIFMLERRPSVTALREFFNKKGVDLDGDGNLTHPRMIEEIAAKHGVRPFVKTSASLTVLK